MINLIKIISIVIVLFNFTSIVLLVSISKRFGREFGTAIKIIIFTLFVLFVRSLLRIADLVSAENLEKVNVSLGFLIALGVLGASITLFKMIRKIDGKTKNN